MTERLQQIADELLIMAAQDGNRDAFAKLVSRWQKRLWRHAFRLTGDPEGAWDISQEAWLAMVKGLGRLHDPASFPAWAYRISTHKARDWIRTRRKNQTEPLETDPSQPASTPSDWGIEALVARLEPAQQALLKCYYFDRASIARIAQRLAIPPGTVKSRLYHARQALKALIIHEP